MTRKHVSVLGGVLALGFLLLAGCGGGDNPTGGGGGGGGGAKELNSGDITAGNTFSHTFNTAGTFPYHCTIHGLAMSGTLTVAAGGTAGATIAIGDNFYNPSSGVTIAPGTAVTWTNGGGITHTVTSN